MIAIGSDHAGFFLKKHLIQYFISEGLEYIDFGTDSTDSVDFPDYAEKISLSILDGQCDKGILICGTGIGMSIAANKFCDIRAALCPTIYHARLSKQHNNANILVLGSRTTGEGLALEITKEWLRAKYLGGNYEKRNKKIRCLGLTAGKED